MHPNSYDSYNDIDKSNNSAVAIILEYMNEESINDLFQSTRLQSDFARNYSEVKTELFNFYNQIDFKFCIFNNSSFQTTDVEGNITYNTPTNFIRFLTNDKRRNNQMIVSKSNSDGIRNLYIGSFYYIGYIKDSNPNISIPYDFKVMVACNLLRSKKKFTDKLTSIDLQNLNIRFFQALEKLKNQYL